MAFNKHQRAEIHAKFQGHCAYCGEEIKRKDMQVDHIEPKYRFSNGLTDGNPDDMSNLNPSCRVCNNWKQVWTLEEFRREIAMQPERAMNNPNHRLAIRYGLIELTNKPVVFFFEKVGKQA